jgi:hypothetical protein
MKMEIKQPSNPTAELNSDVSAFREELFKKAQQATSLEEKLAKIDAPMDPGPLETDFGSVDVESLIKDGRSSIVGYQLTKAIVVDMAILTDDERIQAIKLIDKKKIPDADDPDTFAGLMRRATLARSIGRMVIGTGENAQELFYPVSTGKDGRPDLTKKKELFTFLGKFPSSGIGLLWVKYIELDGQDPFYTNKKKSSPIP